MGMYAVGTSVNRPQSLGQGHSLWDPFWPMMKIPDVLSTDVLMGCLTSKVRLAIHWIPGAGHELKDGTKFRHVCALSSVPGS